jgi:hypothetical protein
MKKSILLLMCLFLISCASNNELENKLKFKYGNDCLPQAIIMAESLKERNINAKVLRIYTDKWGHAICVYVYPKGSNKLWGWDRFWKSMRLRAWVNDPYSVAKKWMQVTLSEDILISAEYDE